MDYKKELEWRDRKIRLLKETIKQLEDDAAAFRELLDCAAANIVMLVRDSGGIRKISGEEVGNILGKYKLSAKKDDDGNYLIEVRES